MTRPSNILLVSLGIVALSASFVAVQHYMKPSGGKDGSLTQATSSPATTPVSNQPDNTQVDSAMNSSPALTTTQVDAFASSIESFDVIPSDTATQEAALAQDSSLDSQLSTNFSQDAY